MTQAADLAHRAMLGAPPGRGTGGPRRRATVHTGLFIPIVGATVVTVLNLQVLKGFSLWLNELKNAGVTIFGFSLADLPTQFEPAKYERMVFGIILVLMMIFRPQGIFPARRRQRELAH